MIKIISDSTCDLSQDLVEKYGIQIVPLHIHLGEEEYEDGVTITPEQIYAWSDANNSTPQTAAISLGEAVEAYEPHLENGDELIVFSISDEMSSTGSTLRLAASELEAEDRIHVINSANLSTGIGLLVLEAAEMIQAGMSATDIVARIEELKPLVSASFVVDTLTYLHRGGRCSGVAALAGGVLQLHPKISVENGKMEAGKKYRGKMNVVVKSYVKEMEEELLHANKKRVFITHSGSDAAIVAQVREYLEGLGHFDEVIETRAGGVVSSHCGPGTLGVLFIREA